MSTQHTPASLKELVNSKDPVQRKEVMALLRQTGLSPNECVKMSLEDKLAHLVEKLCPKGAATGKPATKPAGKGANPAAAVKKAKEPEPEPEPETEPEPGDSEGAEGEAVDSGAVAEVAQAVASLAEKFEELTGTVNLIQTLALETHAIVRSIAASNGLGDDELKEFKESHYGSLVYDEGNG